MTKNQKSIVSFVHTKPETIFHDINRLMHLGKYQSVIDPAKETLLKINISWQHWYPATSTSPWQLEGVIRTLQDDGYNNLIGAHNGTVVVDSYEGEINNKHKVVTDKYSIPTIHLDSEPNRWIEYQPIENLMVLNDVFPEGITIPETFPGKNIIHLPTMKTHVFTTMTGAMKNAFGGLLNRKRHWTHSVIHETLVDLLTIQKEIHPGIFAVMDGTFAGDGPGPRAMQWHTPGILIGSSDQVAIDAVAAHLMGFDPMSIKFIRLAHEKGLGCGDISQINFVGDDISGINYGFTSKQNTFASRGQKLIYWGPMKPLEKLLLQTPIVPWAFLASNLYHNGYWLNFIGKKRIKKALQTPWGKLFSKY